MKVSLVVPVYNVEKYLSICLDSVLHQTFTDWEAVCVDDGSTDTSGAILDKYANRDGRIRVIHTKNGGYGNAMNIGIDAALGEYVGIVESDDAILPDFCETLYEAVRRLDLDIVKSDCFFCWDKENYRYRFHLRELDEYYGTVLLKENAWLRCQFLMNTWAGLYRKSFLNQYSIRHHNSPGASYQDNGFWIQGMVFAERMMVLDYAGYLYRQDNEGASIRDERKVYAMSDEYVWIGETLSGRISKEAMNIVDEFRLTRGYWNLFRIADGEKRSFCDRLLKDYEQYGKVFSENEEWKKCFEEIKSDPDQFCEQIIEKKKYVKEQLDKTLSIIIYGAGKRGETLFRVLCNYGWIDKLVCFVESEVPKKERIGKVPVKRFGELHEILNNAVVIISPSEGTNAANCMKKNIESQGVVNYLSSNIILENYYLVC